jgi:cobalt transporter subunit CbtA
MYFRNIVFSSFAAALLACLFFSIYQILIITPIIQNAEAYEIIDTATSLDSKFVEATWAPAEGAERLSFTIVTTFLTSFGYALILLSAMAYNEKVSVAKGLLWGFAGYIVFFAAPGFGLPPEIPGMKAAAIEGRQAWWLLTVLLTACGIALFVFWKNNARLFALIILIFPHLIGSPEPAVHGFTHPDPMVVETLHGLWEQFVIQTSIANAIFWLIIGATGAFFVARFINPINKQA